MTKSNGARRGTGAAGSIVLLTLLLAACAPQIGGPAPVINGNESSAPPAQITVERGQTLSGIAHTYHVPMQAIAEANHLAPPYRILAGGTLLIPGGMGPGGNSGFAGPPEAPVAIAPLPPPPLPPSQIASGPAPAYSGGYRPIPLDRPAPTVPLQPEIASRAVPDRQADQADRAIPLDRPPPAAPGATLTPPGGAAAPARSAAIRAPAEPPTPAHPPPASGAMAAVEPPPTAHRGGAFLWPVRGRVLENYGPGPDGTHNDGINIAAPRGAPVQATAAGIVAYAGNELRGYGNLILIKHPDGWISAYAHCDLILVKTGQKVARGQVIARVGSTGNVSAPQLHFELRRGKHPVDPRDYLTPLPTAAAREADPG